MAYGVWFRNGKCVRSGPRNGRIELDELGNRVVRHLDDENYVSKLIQLKILPGDPLVHQQRLIAARLGGRRW